MIPIERQTPLFLLSGLTAAICLPFSLRYHIIYISHQILVETLHCNVSGNVKSILSK
jgi:hypothetical protein